jgi:hypothetical protein
MSRIVIVILHNLILILLAAFPTAPDSALCDGQCP